jgi:hypothetical protein
MTDRSRIATAACAGTALGAAWGWLYLTASGTAFRDSASSALDHFIEDTKAARATAEKARIAIAEARGALEDVGAIGGRA